ncbi:MAG: hypothetical protein WCL61_02325 [bacterium]
MELKNILQLDKEQWRKKWQKYFAIAKVNYQSQTTYVGNNIGRAVTVLLRIWIFTQVYQLSYSVMGVSEVNGLTLPMMIWILMFTQGFQSSARPPAFRLIGNEVQAGDLAYTINRPYHYLVYHFFAYMGRVSANFFFNIIIGAIAAFVLVGLVGFSVKGLILGGCLLLFGYVLDFIISAILGLCAFWMEDIRALGWIYSKALMVLGGQVVPIAMFPDALKKIVELLPFASIFYTPSLLIVNFSWPVFIKFLLVQIFWLVVLLWVVKKVYQRGVKNLSINGG